jgi:hypothetical protein
MNLGLNRTDYPGVRRGGSGLVQTCAPGCGDHDAVIRKNVFVMREVVLSKADKDASLRRS